jgi:hypothetical protein
VLVAWRQSRGAADPEVRLVANALLVGFCGLAVLGFINPVVEYHALSLLWLYAGVALNLPRIDKGRQPARSRSTGRQPAPRPAEAPAG